MPGAKLGTVVKSWRLPALTQCEETDLIEELKARKDMGHI